jgi:hypothetical protein
MSVLSLFLTNFGFAAKNANQHACIDSGGKTLRRKRRAVCQGSSAYTHPPHLFWSPFVEKVYHSANYANERDKSDEIVYLEPYKCDYAFNEEHICSWWARQIGIAFDFATDLPQIALGDKADEAAAETLKPYERQTIGLVQFSGGQSPEAFSANAVYDYNIMRSQRNYYPSMANILMSHLVEKYPDILWLDFSLANEPPIKHTIRLETSYIIAPYLAKKARYIIAIDSCLAHFAASVEKPSVVLWNEYAAKPNKFGWHIHENLVKPNMEHDYKDILNSLENIGEKAEQNG